MARILVTGGAGFIGSHCVKLLSEAGHQCVVLDNLSTGHRQFVRWGPLIEADIRDAAALRQAFAADRFDAVVHFAALAYVGESVGAPGRYYDVNVNGTRVLLDAMVAAGVQRLVFSSSCAVYGEPPRLPITEVMPVAPMSPYGMTKWIGECMMRDFARAHGLRTVMLRYFNAAGADRSGLIGEDHTPETHLVPLVLEAAAGRRPSIRVYGSDYPTPDGTAVRDYIHVEDLAQAHLLALQRLLAGGSGLAVNLGTGSGASVLEVVAAARRVSGRPVAVEMHERRPGDPAHLVADARLAGEVLGWRPRCSDIEAIVSDAWAWHCRRFGSGTSADGRAA